MFCLRLPDGQAVLFVYGGSAGSASMIDSSVWMCTLYVDTLHMCLKTSRHAHPHEAFEIYFSGWLLMGVAR